MITRKDAEKILMLFNSHNNANAVIALKLLWSLDAHDALSQCIAEYLPSNCQEVFEVKDALYAYQGEKTPEYILSILQNWDKLMVKAEVSTKLKRTSFNVLYDLLQLSYSYSPHLINGHIKLLVLDNNNGYDIWLQEDWYQEHALNLLPQLQLVNRTPLNTLNQPFDPQLTLRQRLKKHFGSNHSIVNIKPEVITLSKRLNTPIYYAIFPNNHFDQGTIILKLTL